MVSPRVIEVTTPAGVGATYIPIDRKKERVSVQCIVDGTVTYTVDYTLQNIIRAAANPTDISPNLVTPANADWSELIASGSADADFVGQVNAYALRVDITAGTGSVTIRIAQNP